MFEKAFLIEDVTDSIKVEHHKYWAPPFVSKRDMCVRLNKARLDTFRHSFGAGEPKTERKERKRMETLASGADVIGCGGGCLIALSV